MLYGFCAPTHTKISSLLACWFHLAIKVEFFILIEVLSEANALKNNSLLVCGIQQLFLGSLEVRFMD